MRERVSRRVAAITPCLLAFLLTIAVYYPALDASLVADDFWLVGQVTFQNGLDYFKQTWGFARNEYRPLTALSFALDTFLWGDDPRGYHLTNILLHAINAGLVFLWTRKLLGDFPIAIVTSLFFIIHPANHSRVIWISARDGSLSTMFLLASLCAYAASRRQQKPSAARFYNLVSLLSFGGALLSYEGAVILPFVLLLVEVVFHGGEEPTGRRLRIGLKRVLPHFGVLLAYAGMWVLLFRGALGAHALSLEIQSIWKNYSSLSHRLFYGYQKLAGILYLLLVLSAYRVLKEKTPLVMFSVLLSVLCFAPFAVIQGFAFRFAYTSSIGYCLLLAIAFTFAARLHRNQAWRPAALAALMAGLAIYYTVDVRKRISEWREAGRIAQSIPAQLKELHPQLPGSATLFLGRIPRMYRDALVFPLGLRAAIHKHYQRADLEIYYDDKPLDQFAWRAGKGELGTAYYFEYFMDQRKLVQIQ